MSRVSAIAPRLDQLSLLDVSPDELGDRRRAGEHSGAARLMRALVRSGLDRDAVQAAARLVIELERQAQREKAGT